MLMAHLLNSGMMATSSIAEDADPAKEVCKLAKLKHIKEGRGKRLTVEKKPELTKKEVAEF